MTAPKTPFSLHQMMGSEKVSLSESSPGTPITRDDLEDRQLGLGEAWLEAIAPQELEKLERRFAWSGLDREALYRVLDQLEQPDEPSRTEIWFQELTFLQEALRSDPERELEPYVEEVSEANPDQLPFSDLWLPAVEAFVARLRSNLVDLQHRSIDDQVYRSLGRSLLTRLSSISEQALFEQFNLQRPPGAMLLAHLGTDGDGQGPPVREYYERFIREYRCDGLATFLETFPVLGRYLGQVCGDWQRSNETLLRRIDADAIPLQQLFGVEPEMVLSGVHQGLSDPHNHGQVVSILKFAQADGSSSVQVVYKPKDMGVDLAYQQALEHLNSVSTLKPLRSLRIYCGNDYGYMEHVEHRLCEGDDEQERFYRNAGRLTAVLHLLGCTDCHYENLIACGDQLLLIDTETLLEADLPDHVSDASDQQTALSQSNLQKSFQNSVLRSGLMPNWLFVGQAKVAVDISALGIAPPLKPLTKGPGWLGLNSDGMMAAQISRPSLLPTSLPVGVGATNGLNAHLETFCQGFREQCSEFERTREDWIRPGGVLDQFRGLPRRIVLRATRVYFALQRQQLEPAALRSSLRQGLVLEQLSRSFLMASEQPLHWPVFEAELRQMERLDIPFFVHSIDGQDLPLVDDMKPVEGFMETSGLESSRQRIAELDPAAVAFQEQLIRGTSRARISTEVGRSPRDVVAPNVDVLTLTPEQLYQESRRQLEMLEEIAIRDADGLIDWLGMDLGSDGESFCFGPVGTSLYGGSIGVALLAAHFADEPGPAELVESCVKPLLQMGEKDRDGLRLRWWRDQALGLSGCGGSLLSIQELATWGPESQQPMLQELQTSLIEALLPEHIRADLGLDMIAGVTGLMGPLLRDGSIRALDLAVIAGDHLLGLQNEHGAWSVRGKQPLLGFSHGTAGYLAALVKLGQQLGEQRFLDAAAKALTYERERFDVEHLNWPDYRDHQPDEPNKFMTSWCHGAPGIALSRACLFGSPLWDEQCVDEMANALQTLTALSLPFCDHLCCGTFGNAGILRVVAEGPWAKSVTESVRTAAINRSSELVAQAVSIADQSGGAFRGFGTSEGNLLLPGCFTGMSGMGLALLDQMNRDDRLGTLMTIGLLSPAGAIATTPMHESASKAS
ncbi:type 2 lanthipeptide synthetase LanM family protein [Synechococcus sp. UW179A]|uniref:type 2 lanthipeptide synthetase LanM family protein n=1 Tax=Synechococcus sp. UW179A TaxID=2575510 RepID=UPI000E0FB09F|nr:type 2 lanthipeptide synthetase LanM family protein [Synechococcus sp. UW179A]